MLSTSNAMDDLAMNAAEIAVEITVEIAVEIAVEISLEAPWDGRKTHFPIEEKHCTALIAEVSFGVHAERAQELWEKIQVLVRMRS